MDDEASPAGDAVFRVYTGDGEGGWKQAYESPIVRGGDPPLPISVNLQESQAIALIVEYADRGDGKDYANWLNAHFRVILV